MKEDIENALIKELGEGLQTNVRLSDYCSLGVGGVADYFYIADDISHLTLAVNAAVRFSLPYCIIGGGNDILPSDNGFYGLIIKNNSNNVVFSPDGSEVIVDSGVSLAKLINLAAGRDLGGLEFLASDLATVGGAVYGNRSFAGSSIGDFVKSATLLTAGENDTKIINVTNDWLKFSHNESRIKRTFSTHKPVVLTVRFQLIKRRKDEILRLINESLRQKVTGRKDGDRVITDFFNNKEDGCEYNISLLLEQIGARKIRNGGARVAQFNPNCIANFKNATAADIRGLADQLRQFVFEKFNYLLEERVEYIGRW
jgi:UDP-N-acetylmuramate dehydrogenase